MMSVNNIAVLLYKEAQLSETRSNQARVRKPKERKSWSQEQDRFSDRMFYCLFRMSCGCFNLLCDKIKSAVGEYEFKSELFLKGLKKHMNLVCTTTQSCTMEIIFLVR